MKIAAQEFEVGDFLNNFFKDLGVFEAHFLMKKFLIKNVYFTQTLQAPMKSILVQRFVNFSIFAAAADKTKFEFVIRKFNNTKGHSFIYIK